MNELYDVIVVGAGPSGCIASYTATKLGLNVLLIEKEKIPRYKPCAGGLTPKSVEFLKKRNLFNRELVERECFKIKVFIGDKNIVQSFGKPIVTTVERSRFDAYLVEKAIESGCVLAENERVKGLRIYDGGVKVATNRGKIFCSKLIIGADGVNSSVAKLSGLRERWRPNEVLLAFETTLPRKVFDPDLDDTAVEVYFNHTYTGYGWVFPKGNSISLGLVGWLPRFPHPRRQFQYFLSSLPHSLPTLNIRFNAHLIPLRINWSNPSIYTDHVLLCGDAAGFVDPWTGEGIYYAMLSGEIAANTVKESIEEEKYGRDFLHRYWLSCKKRFGDNLKAGLLFSRIFYNNLSLSLRLLEKDPKIRQYLLPLTSGEMSYRKLLVKCIYRMFASIL